jgi:hypothetical protein
MRIAALLALAVAAPLMAQPAMAPLPPIRAWHGASERLVAKPGDAWITPAEAANFVTTPDYAATRAWLEKLAAASPLIKLSMFGHTAQGRDMLLVTVSKDGATFDPNKPLVLVQAGIHAGEIDGKDAGLMLLRDIALRGKDTLLDHANLLFVPMFNADGHERISAFNRPNQRGPANQGWRTTAQNLNLNRDYLKADTPEMVAMLGLIGRANPDLYLDLHVTDGVDYQYDITFGYNGYEGRPSRSPAIAAWLDGTYRPAVTAALTRAGHIPGRLITARDDRKPDDGIVDDVTPPRFSTGYGDTRRLPTILVENHSLKPYRQRVLGTYVLLESTLTAAGAHADTLKAAIAADRARRPASIVASWKWRTEPVMVDWKGIAHTTYPSPATGGNEVRWLGTPVTGRMPLFSQKPDKLATMPKAWWVPATRPDIIAKLKLHGVTLEPVAATQMVDVDMLRLVDPKIATHANEGHIELMVGAVTRAARRETFPAGSVRVPSDQPLGELVAMLLDPASPESLLAWGEFPEILQRTEYIEGYAMAPLADRMLADPAIKAALDAKLASDPKFAADPDARLGWFYARTPYYDDRYLLYPIGFER